MVAQIDPLGLPAPAPARSSTRRYYGFTEADLDRPFSTGTIYGPDVLTLREILERLRNTYCRSIGVQFMHIDDLGVPRLAAGAHGGHARTASQLTRDEQLRILTRLTDAVIFEEFVQKKYVGAKTLLARRRPRA